MEREVQVGQLVAGKYRIQQMLGRGGMGVVMAALHEHLNQHVALKFLTDEAYQQPEAVTRFLREARSAVQIQSEHVARVMDVGTLESGAPYIVMEYLRGLDLKEVSTRRGPLPIHEAVDYVLQACDAVAEAHSLGIVHRDLKPSNLFLTERPDGSPLVKVLDFGISKALNGGRGGETSKQQMTASAAIMGSPQYMSPEQIRSSKNVDARADVWALGTILHELLAGTPAYVADTVPGLLAMIVADPPPPLSSSRPDAPPELEAIILRCLEKDRERRFASVAEFARALERFASPETRPLVRRIARVLGDTSDASQSYRSIPPGLATQHEPVNQTHNTWARTGRLSEPASVPFHARPSVQLGAGLGLVGAGLLAAWLLFSGGRPTASAPVQTTTTTKSVKPEADGKAAADTAGRAELAPTPTIVRPVREPEPPIRPAPPEPPPQQAAPPQALEDDDPRAPHNFRDDDTPYPSASAKKKELAAAQRRARPRQRTQHVEPPPERAPAVSPEAEPKKSNPLDLFDDTR
jgi:serine/threonine-protein kinase